jgi:hypothetical protein
VRLQVTEYQMIEVACPACRKVTRAATPAGLAGPCCYGPNVRAATALLACNGHMSIERAAGLMGVLLDAPVPTGFTGGLLARVAASLAEFEGTLKQRLRAAAVLHHDETPARVAGDDSDRLLYIYTARAGRRSNPAGQRDPAISRCVMPSEGVACAARQQDPDSRANLAQTCPRSRLSQDSRNWRKARTGRARCQGLETCGLRVRCSDAYFRKLESQECYDVQSSTATPRCKVA